MAVFDDAEIGVPCPGCGHKNPKKISWIKTHTQMVCAGCGETVTIDSTKLQKGLAEVDKSISDLRKKFAKIGKRR